MNDAVSELSLFDPTTLVDPFEFYEQQRAKSPVYLDKPSGTYVVLDHALITEAVGRLDDFSNQFNARLSGGDSEESLQEDKELQAIIDEGWPQVNTLLTADQPVHTRFRKLVNMAFSMPKVNKLEDGIRAMSNQLIDGFIDKGQCEFVNDYAVPMPVKTIADQLGLDRADAAVIKRWTVAFVDRLSGMMTRERTLEAEREVVEFQKTLKVNMDDRRAEAKEDILSDLVNAQLDGERSLDAQSCCRSFSSLWWPATKPQPQPLLKACGCLPPTPKSTRRFRQTRRLFLTRLRKCCACRAALQAFGASCIETQNLAALPCPRARW